MSELGLNLFKYGSQLKSVPDEYQEMDTEALKQQIRDAKEDLGDNLILLGHNYQQKDVFELCDFTGDSYKLSKKAAELSDYEYVVFCGVSFMAESADILTADHQSVILPSMAAACPMAGMAEVVQVKQAWENLTEHVPEEDVVPVTYMNSYADLKAFCARHGGTVCTSSNAETIFQWAFDRDKKIFFFPDEHLGRNVATFLDVRDERQPLWNPWAGELGGLSREAIHDGKVYLWAGNCQVHQRFTVEDVATVRQNHENVNVIVHPECRRDVVRESDVNGRTSTIIDTIDNAEPGSTWAVGTEFNLVDHLDRRNPEKDVLPLGCEDCIDCNAMAQINPSYLLWTLEELRDDNPVNVISVEAKSSRYAKQALDRMIDLTTDQTSSAAVA